MKRWYFFVDEEMDNFVDEDMGHYCSVDEERGKM
jgi:hypothetical protein